MDSSAVKGGLYSGASQALGAGSKKSKLKKAAPVLTIGAFLIIPLLFVALALTPSLMIATIGENLKNFLGFNDSTAILEKQTEHTVAEYLKKGKVPDGLADDLLAQGIEVGQTTLAGEFVRTNTYIANIENLSEVAADGEYYAQGETGELAVRFNDEVITADNFVARVEASSEMYAAYSDAVDIAARYYYSDAVNSVYSDMGLSRSAFSGWQSSNNSAQNKANFDEMLSKALDKRGAQSLAGHYKLWHEHSVTGADDKSIRWYASHNVDWECNGSGTKWTCVKTVDRNPKNGCPGVSDDTDSITGESNEVARKLVTWVAENSRNDNDSGTSANENAAQILNATVSADEPYKAANDFMVLISTIERAQITGDGPINEMMNKLSDPTEISFTDIKTGETITEKKSVLETDNFVAAISNGSFSLNEANNFARDRILNASGLTDAAAIKKTSIISTGKRSGNGYVMNNNTVNDNAAADLSTLEPIISSVALALSDKNSDLFATVVGGNRILEGGSFIHNAIDMQVAGAMPSNEAQVQAYQQEVSEVIARQAAAERATKSPFDTSSPYTFMGGLVRKMAIASIKNTNSESGILSTITNAFGSVFNSLLSIFTPNAAADSNIKMSSLIGECDTTGVAGVTCDPYGTNHTTLSISYMDYTEEDFMEAMPGAFKSDGELSETGAVAQFLLLGAERDVTVGVRSYDVCEKYLQLEDESGNWLTRLFRKFVNWVTGANNLVNACNSADAKSGSDAISTGAKYVLKGEGNSENDLLSAYVRYDLTKSLLEEKDGKVARLKAVLSENALAVEDTSELVTSSDN